MTRLNSKDALDFANKLFLEAGKRPWSSRESLSYYRKSGKLPAKIYESETGGFWIYESADIERLVLTVRTKGRPRADLTEVIRLMGRRSDASLASIAGTNKRTVARRRNALKIAPFDPAIPSPPPPIRWKCKVHGVKKVGEVVRGNGTGEGRVFLDYEKRTFFRSEAPEKEFAPVDLKSKPILNPKCPDCQDVMELLTDRRDLLELVTEI